MIRLGGRRLARVLVGVCFMFTLGRVCAQDAEQAAPHEEILRVVIGEGATEPLLISLLSPDQRPKYLVLLFPGGDGDMKLREENGRIRFALAGNFLLRARRHLLDEETAVVAVDAPSDQILWDSFRLGERHAGDIGKVIDTLRQRFPGTHVYLLGTSHGTVSVASLAARLADKIDGAVLSSTTLLATRKEPMLSAFDYSSIKVPTLMVHHRHDACFVCPYSGARNVAAKNGFQLVTVSGAEGVRGDSCGAYSQHGYPGREQATMAAIRLWIKTRQAVADIE